MSGSRGRARGSSIARATPAASSQPKPGESGAGMNSPRTFRNTAPPIDTLARGLGSTWSTVIYQNTICSSCGVLRTSSTSARAVQDASGFTDRRMSASTRPSAVANAMASALASRVLSPDTSNARPVRVGGGPSC